jgi:hypothetical protein
VWSGSSVLPIKTYLEVTRRRLTASKVFGRFLLALPLFRSAEDFTGAGEPPLPFAMSFSLIGRAVAPATAPKGYRTYRRYAGHVRRTFLTGNLGGLHDGVVNGSNNLARGAFVVVSWHRYYLTQKFVKLMYDSIFTRHGNAPSSKR